MRLFLAAAAVAMTFLWGAAWGAAQALQPQPATPPTVLAGNDIGFRITGRDGGRPVGTLVVRADGKWVEPKFAGGLRLLTK